MKTLRYLQLYSTCSCSTCLKSTASITAAYYTIIWFISLSLTCMPYHGGQDPTNLNIKKTPLLFDISTHRNQKMLYTDVVTHKFYPTYLLPSKVLKLINTYILELRMHVKSRPILASAGHRAGSANRSSHPHRIICTESLNPSRRSYNNHIDQSPFWSFALADEFYCFFARRVRITSNLRSNTVPGKPAAKIHNA